MAALCYHSPMDELRPIISDPVTETPPLAGVPKLAKSSFVVMLLAALAGVGALVICGFYFAGFAENDAQLGNLTSAFVLCFGIGALAYVPMFWISRIARQVRLKGPSRRAVLLILALIIPWLILSLSLVATRIPLVFIGIGLTVFCLFILSWAWAVYRAI